ncbi:hypothetical protein IE077_002539, partial [Cardiosporidium cionae]
VCWRRNTFPKVDKRLQAYCFLTFSDRLESYSSIIKKEKMSDSVQENDFSTVSNCDDFDYKSLLLDEDISIDPLDDLSIEVRPVPALWEEYDISGAGFSDMQAFRDARETAIEIAFHRWQSKGARIFPSELRPPDPDLDIINVSGLALSERDEKSLLLSLFVSSCDGLAMYIHRRKKTDVSMHEQTLPIPAAAADKKRPRRKDNRRIIGADNSRGDAAHSHARKLKDSVEWDSIELALLDRYITLYQGSGTSSKSLGTTYVNWDLIALAITTAIGVSGISHRIRTAKQCEERWNRLKKEAHAPKLPYFKGNEIEYKARVYSSVPPVFLANRLPRGCEFSTLIPFSSRSLENMRKRYRVKEASSFVEEKSVTPTHIRPAISWNGLSPENISCCEVIQKCIGSLNENPEYITAMLHLDFRSEFKTELESGNALEFNADTLLYHCADMRSYLLRREKESQHRTGNAMVHKAAEYFKGPSEKSNLTDSFTMGDNAKSTDTDISMIREDSFLDHGAIHSVNSWSCEQPVLASALSGLFCESSGGKELGSSCRNDFEELSTARGTPIPMPEISNLSYRSAKPSIIKAIHGALSYEIVSYLLDALRNVRSKC